MRTFFVVCGSVRGGSIQSIGRGLVVVLGFLIVADEALARGGGRQLRWGYRPPAGDPLINAFRFADPWSALNGGGIPRRNLGAANLNMGGPGGGSRQSGGSSLPGRTTVFPGRNTQTASVTPRRWTGWGNAQTFVTTPASGYTPAEDLFVPPYYHSENDDWHHGYWGGGLWGWSEWDGRLGFLSFPRWSVGPWYYTSEYGVYHNPFVEEDPRLKSYATVIEVEVEDPADSTGEIDSGTSATPDPKAPASEKAPSAPTPADRREKAAGRKAFAAAREAFRNRDYATAQQKIDEALVSLLHDPAVHEFRGLVLTAQGEYKHAAAVLYDVLAVSPGWDWTTLSSLYADPEEYTRQLRAMEAYRRQNPEAPEAAFLVAYHYASCGHHTIATRHLKNVVRLLPRDNLTPHLLTLLTDASASNVADPTTGAASPAATAPVITPAENAPVSIEHGGIELGKLAGVWHASRAADVRITLSFEGESNFTWVAQHAGQEERFEGTFLQARDRLILACEEGTMIAEVTLRSLGGGFNFRLIENDPRDPGLDFSR